MTATDTAPADADTAAMPCPRCGYDLRGTTSKQCSECGFAFDPAKLVLSALPWTHRGRLGRIKAFRRTCALMTWDGKRVRHELSRPHIRDDARRFSRWMTVAFALALIATTFLNTARDEVVLGAVPRYFRPVRGYDDIYSKPPPVWWQQTAVPWAMGATAPLLLPVYLLALAAWWSRLGVGPARRLTRSAAPCHAEAAEAIARYAAGPLLWTLLAALLFAVAVGSYHLSRLERSLSGNAEELVKAAALAIGCVGLVIGVAGAWLSLHRGAQWYRRARHGGVASYLVGLLDLSWRAAAGMTVCLVLLPWWIGYVMLAVDLWR